jgi:hypothetical protein
LVHQRRCLTKIIELAEMSPYLDSCTNATVSLAPASKFHGQTREPQF